MVWANYEYAWGGTYQRYYKEQSLNGTPIDKDHLQPLKFQGQFFDPETSLHYNRFRYYDSDVGMFIQRDPIGLLGGFNIYQYAPNPIGWVDPLGLYSDLNHNGMGHHIMPRSIAKALGIADLGQKNSIAWYPNNPTDSSKLHKAIHNALKEAGIPFRGSTFKGSVDDFFKLAKEAYKNFDDVGFMKMPTPSRKKQNKPLFTNITPLQALEELENLYRSGKIPKPTNGCTGVK